MKFNGAREAPCLTPLSTNVPSSQSAQEPLEDQIHPGSLYAASVMGILVQVSRESKPRRGEVQKDAKWVVHSS